MISTTSNSSSSPTNSCTRAIDYDDERHSNEPVTIIMNAPRPDRSQDEDHSPAIQRT